MPATNILTVRLPEAELARLEELAKLRQLPKSQIVQEAIRELLDADERLRLQDFNRIKSRLKPAIDEQCSLLDEISVADEHRRF